MWIRLYKVNKGRIPSCGSDCDLGSDLCCHWSQLVAYCPSEKPYSRNPLSYTFVSLSYRLIFPLKPLPLLYSHYNLIKHGRTQRPGFSYIFLYSSLNWCIFLSLAPSFSLVPTLLFTSWNARCNTESLSDTEGEGDKKRKLDLPTGGGILFFYFFYCHQRRSLKNRHCETNLLLALSSSFRSCCTAFFTSPLLLSFFHLSLFLFLNILGLLVIAFVPRRICFCVPSLFLFRCCRRKKVKAPQFVSPGRGGGGT